MPDFADTFDFMCQSSVLRQHGTKRTLFDPTNLDHIESMKTYLETGRWTVQFFCEDPFIDVPMTVFRKFIGHQLGVSVTSQQRARAKQHLQEISQFFGETQ